MRRDFKLLIFDWDGTLMDSAAQIVACMQSALADMRVDPLADDVIRNIIGLGLAQAMQTLLPHHTEQVREQVSLHYRRHFLACGKEALRFFPGVAEALATLHADGYLLAVATGKGRQGLHKALHDTGVNALFATSRCAEETRSKPHPQMLFEILQELDVAPADALMIGDTEYDLEMANAAGMAGIAVTCGVHSHERLMLHKPVACLEMIAELPAWLHKAATAWPSTQADSPRHSSECEFRNV